MVISTYSNILLSVSMIIMTYGVYQCSQNGHLDCLKYLHETAKAPWDYGPYESRTRTTNPNVYNTSSTTTVLSHAVGDTSTASYSFTDQSKKNQSNIYNTQTHTHTHMYSS